MRKEVSIAVVLPALNEEASLAGVLARIPDWVNRVLVVDNGSTDGTAAVARAAGARVIVQPRRGYGRACLAGIAAADETDIIIFMDADGSDFPEQMKQLVEPIVEGRADMVIGSRTLGKCERGALTVVQRFGNALATTMIRLIWDVTFTDLGPFRAIRAAALRQLDMDEETFGWTVQMQIRAARFGMRCAEIPVDYARRTAGRSKITGTLSGIFLASAVILRSIARESLKPRFQSPRASEYLAVFAKQPKPGHSKTRLIPALGAHGAANLHRQMTFHTLEQVAELKRSRNVRCEVWHTANDNAASVDCFGHMPRRPQVEGDLGQRMLHAFDTMLRHASAAVIIGTDCPDLCAHDLLAAFDALHKHDLVIGPANDGGYYLIGLRRPAPSLFMAMTWSHDRVMEQTLIRARKLGLRVHLLSPHDDVDEPKDLSAWDRAMALADERRAQNTPLLSVVIPTLNEAHAIARTIEAVRRDGVEIIVSDGGSSDETRTIATAHGAKVTQASPGRGPQLNAGAAVARADLLMFLHADTTLPSDFLQTVTRTLADESIALGAFRFKLDRVGWQFRIIEQAVGLRCALFNAPYGDQAMFMRATTFRAISGFATIPLMEDFALVRRSRKIGAVRVVSAPAMTSARRWVTDGVVRTILMNQLCVIGYILGVSPRRLASWRNQVSAAPPTRVEKTPDQSDGLARLIDIESTERRGERRSRGRGEEVDEPVLLPDVDLAGIVGRDRT